LKTRHLKTPSERQTLPPAPPPPPTHGMLVVSLRCLNVSVFKVRAKLGKLYYEVLHTNTLVILC